MNININLENLFYMVMEHFENTESYHKIRLACWEKQNGQLRKLGLSPKNCPLYVDLLKGRDAHDFARACERAEHGERVMSGFCAMLGIDRQKLYCMVRAVKKWHDARGWQVCFPFSESNTKAILGYVRT